MVEIYSSWKKGLPSDKEALAVIKDSGVIAGIELSMIGEDIELIKSAGLKYNLHNPFRDYRVGLDSENFIPLMFKFPQVARACEESNPPAIGFHAGYFSTEDEPITIERIVKNTLKSIRFLDNNLNKKVIFESLPYDKECSLHDNQEIVAHVTSPRFFKEILTHSKAGFLFDVAHNLISGTTKINHKEYKGEILDYFSDILSVAAKKTYQMHLNVPMGDSKAGYIDKHLPLKISQKNSKTILFLAKEVLDACPNLKTVTLEMDSLGNSTKHHAKLLVEQAKLIEKHLL